MRPALALQVVCVALAVVVVVVTMVACHCGDLSLSHSVTGQPAVESVTSPGVPLASASAGSASVESGPKAGSATACILADLPFQTHRLWAISGFQWNADDSLAYVGPTACTCSITGALMLASPPLFDAPRLLAPDALVGDPMWSPGGSSIAFVAFRSSDQLGTVVSVNSDGSGLRDLLPGELARTNPGTGPKSVAGWLDAAHLLVLTDCGSGCTRPQRLGLSDGSLTPQFTSGQEGSDYYWDPSRSQVVVAASENLAIGVAPGNGGTVRWLSGYQAPDPAWAQVWTSFAGWSPNGLRFLFLRQPDDESAAPELWLWDVGAGTASKLFADVVAASWSPNGDRIAAVLMGRPHYGAGGALLGTEATADGPNPVGLGLYKLAEGKILSFRELGQVDLGCRMRIDSGDWLEPVWSPEGEHLLYYDGAGQTWILSATDGSSSRLGANGTVGEVRWSPNGKYLAVEVPDRLLVFDVACLP